MGSVCCALPGSKTSPDRSIRWTPSGAAPVAHDGVLAVTDRKGTTEYAVTEFLPDAGWDGRAFQVAKLDGSEGYSVFLARNGQDHTCDCAAGTYRRVAECRHVAALVTLLRDGHLDDPRADPRPAEPVTDGAELPF